MFHLLYPLLLLLLLVLQLLVVPQSTICSWTESKLLFRSYAVADVFPVLLPTLLVTLLLAPPPPLAVLSKLARCAITVAVVVGWVVKLADVAEEEDAADSVSAPRREERKLL